ncbi:hypothetical protein JAAARDRAFT_126899 [Jaapia argillacea MUCL 33604]|uniref:Uncharacterized protein n=1 Tax=Jaapia argillacea MUCL 33604 TaxID=933084 RepID=A0A067Q806_9AGAM|nr:hypothetical protein JAAARDRAFT_126899 [Jaapia argillacea MUCL 33604]
MEVHGEDICIGYDIGCALERTIEKSSLGPKAKELRLCLAVGAFHGHAHNCGCQLNWHPLYIKGIGRSDLEGCERAFASSNAVTPTTQHASKFHRHQAVEQHFSFLDEDKYVLMTLFFFNHYREALHIANNWPEQLQELQSRLNISEDDFAIFIQQEREYLQGLKKEPPEETLQFNYVKALEALVSTESDLNNARNAVDFVMYTPAQSNVHDSLVKGNRVLCSCQKKWENTLATVTQLENQLSIEGQWAVDSVEYKEVKEKLREREYQKALDELERLVVQRLFELSKLNVSGTGNVNDLS